MKSLESIIVTIAISVYLTIYSGFVELEPEMVGAKTDQPNQNQPQKPKKAKIALNSNDKLYAEIRDLNFSVIGPLLNKKAKEIDEYYKVTQFIKQILIKSRNVTVLKLLHNLGTL
jgi:hypothetical protein